jgi:predicted Zn-dependent protease
MDTKVIRSSTYVSEGERIEDRQQGPADEFGLPGFDALHAHVLRLREALRGMERERTEIRVQTQARRLAGGPTHARVSATVRLIVVGPRTRSPVLWQTGGTRVQLEDWVDDLGRTLPRELEAVHVGEPLVEPWTGTVVLEPWVAALLVHECVGHTSEADNYLDYVRREGIDLGYRWTRAPLTVVDDPTEPDRIGSYVLDDEGQPARRTSVVTDGVWTQLLLDRARAAELGAPASSNGRRVVGAAAALPRMSVLMAMPGEHQVERLIGEIEDGWYVCGSWGAGSMGRRFVLRPTHARRIRDGRLRDRCLRRLELRGDKLDTIAAIDAIGDDLCRFDPAFGCEKDGQDDLPVSFGAPHLRLRGVTLVPMRSPQS